MIYRIEMTDANTGEKVLSAHRFSDEEKAKAWAVRMILHGSWRVVTG